MKLWKRNLILIVIIVIIIFSQLIFIKESEFLGTDTLAENVVMEINPTFEPWINKIFPENSGEMETFFFTLQAAIGASIVGFILGRITAKNELK